MATVRSLTPCRAYFDVDYVFTQALHREKQPGVG